MLMEFLKARPSRAAGVVSMDVLEEKVLFHPARQEAISLNVSSAAIWDLCDGTRTVAEIGHELSEWAGAPDSDVLADVERIVKQFSELSLLHIDTANQIGEDA